VIKFVSDLRQVGGFILVPFTNKTDRHDIAEILLKVVLNTIKPANQPTPLQTYYFRIVEPTLVSSIISFTSSFYCLNCQKLFMELTHS